MRRIVFLCFLVLLLFLTGQAMILSLTTGFSLIDDYGDWKHIEIFDSLSMFLNWLGSTFLFPTPGRFRPFFELGHALTWLVFGEAAWLHHLWRWLCKGLTLYLLFATVRTAGLRAGPGFVLAAALFLLFPNNPEARLAPQELSSGLGLMILLQAWVGRLTGQTLSLLPVLGGSALLFFSKESNIVFVPIFLLFLFFPLPRRREWSSVAFLLILCGYCFFRLSVAMSAGGYGVPSVDRDFPAMLRFVLGQAFLLELGWLPALGMLIVFLAPLILLKERDLRLAIVFLYGVAFCSLAIGVLSWAPVTRYWYLFVPVISLLFAVVLAKNQSWFVPFSLPVLLLVLFMAGPYLFNFVAQNSSTVVEGRLLLDLENRLADGQKIQVSGDAEAAEKIRIFFAEYRPRLRSQPGVALSSETDATFLVTTAREELKIAQEFRETRPFAFQRKIIDLSLTLQGKDPPGLYVDAGVFFPYSYAWYVYARTQP